MVNGRLTEMEQAMLEAWSTDKLERGKMVMQLLLYRKALEDAGIEPPDEEGAELLRLWRDSQAVMTAAAELLKTLGSSAEMLDDAWSKGGNGRWRSYLRPA